MNLALRKELKEKQLWNILGILDRDKEHYELLDLKCQVCEAHLGYMAYFKSDRIYPEFLCDKCKKTII